MKTRFLVLALLFPVTPAVAQTPGWLTNEKTGCKMWVRSIEHLDGFTWTGGCRDGLVSGPGHFTLTLRGEAQWTGRNGFVKGKREGHGTIKTTDGYSLEADYKDGVPDGHALERFPNGDVYNGDYRDGRRDGSGTFRWHDGGSFTGTWAAGMPDGQGVYRDAPAGPAPTHSWSGRWRDGCFLDGESPPIFRAPEECAAKK